MENKNISILVTGANGFVGKNLCLHLEYLGYTNLKKFDIDTEFECLEQWCKDCDFVYHLAGVNRPQNNDEFYTGNQGLTETIIEYLEKYNNNCPVLVTSSVQAELDNDYGKSKLAAENAVFAHEVKTGAPAYVFRLPGVFGKWCRPAYNSVVATFCHNVANDMPIEVRDENYTFPLIYIDDVLKNFVNALDGMVMRDRSLPGYCHGTPVYEASLGRLASLIKSFKNSRKDLMIADMGDEFTKKLYSTYLSYLPKDEFSYPLKMNVDARGSFTEILRTVNAGQVSVNISKPHITKGEHWHHTKNEKYLVVSGSGVVRFRKPFEEEVIEIFANGDDLRVIDIPVGYTHNIENLGDTDMVTIMWCNECFDSENPDTMYLKV